MPVSRTRIRARLPDRSSDDLDAAAFRRELDRVGEQVPDDLLQPAGVAGDRRDPGLDHPLDGDALRLRRGLRAVERRFDHVAAGRPAAPRRLSLPAMMRETSSRSSMSWASVFVLRSIIPTARAVVGRVELLGAQQLRPDEDRAQRRAQLVRDHGDELVLGAVRRLRIEARLLLAAGGLLAHAGQLEMRRDARDQVPGRERLSDVFVGTDRAFSPLPLARGGEHDHRDALGPLVAAQRPREGETVSGVRVGVDEDEVGHPLSRGGERGGEVDGRLRRPSALHEPAQIAAQVGILGDDEDALSRTRQAAAGDRRRGVQHAVGGKMSGAERNRHAHGGLRTAGFDLDGSAVGLRDAAGHRHGAAVIASGRAHDFHHGGVGILPHAHGDLGVARPERAVHERHDEPVPHRAVEVDRLAEGRRIDVDGDVGQNRRRAEHRHELARCQGNVGGHERRVRARARDRSLEDAFHQAEQRGGIPSRQGDALVLRWRQRVVGVFERIRERPEDQAQRGADRPGGSGRSRRFIRMRSGTIDAGMGARSIRHRKNCSTTGPEAGTARGTPAFGDGRKNGGRRRRPP